MTWRLRCLNSGLLWDVCTCVYIYIYVHAYMYIYMYLSTCSVVYDGRREEGSPTCLALPHDTLRIQARRCLRSHPVPTPRCGSQSRGLSGCPSLSRHVQVLMKIKHDPAYTLHCYNFKVFAVWGNAGFVPSTQVTNNIWSCWFLNQISK